MRCSVLVAVFMAAGLCVCIPAEADEVPADYLIDLKPEASQPDGSWAIPDNSALGRDFEFVVDPANSGPIAKVELVLSIAHSWDNDLEAFLVSPYDTEVLLFSRLWQDGANFDGTTFADRSNVLITDGLPPYENVYDVEDPAGLAKFNSDPDAYNANGTAWRLHIADLEAGDEGSLLAAGTQLHIWIVPEPATVTIILVGLASASASARRRRRRRT